jgi:hypothetical protein
MNIFAFHMQVIPSCKQPRALHPQKEQSTAVGERGEVVVGAVGRGGALEAVERGVLRGHRRRGRPVGARRRHLDVAQVELRSPFRRPDELGLHRRHLRRRRGLGQDLQHLRHGGPFQGVGVAARQGEE